MALGKRAKKAKTSKARIEPVIKTGDLPATQKMITLLQKQFKADFKAMDKKFDARFNQVDAKFSQVDARFNQVDAKFSQIDARFNQVDARFSQIDARFNKVDSQMATVLSEVQRIALMIEEQNARNKFVLDGYDQIYKRQERLEGEVDQRLKNIEDVVSRKATSV